MSRMAEKIVIEAKEKVRCVHCSRTDPFLNKTMAAYLCQILTIAIQEAKDMEIVLKRQDGDDKKTVRKEMVKNCFTVGMIKQRAKSHSSYANVSVLKVYGFLTQSDMWRRRGIYQLTPKALYFLRGSISVPLEIVYWMDTLQIYWESEQKISFRDAMGIHMKDVEDHLKDWLGRFIKDDDNPQQELF